MECTLPDLDLEHIVLDNALRTKVKIRYQNLLEKILAIPLWTTYYNTQIKLWIKQTYPKLNTPPDLSASNIVQYLVQTYAALTDNRFLFQETNRDAFVTRLKPLKSKNYLFQYLADEMETAPPPEKPCRPSLFEEVAALIDRCLHTPECRRPVEEALFGVPLPEKFKTEFNQQFLQDLRTQYTKKKNLNATLLSQIEPLEATFFQTHKPVAAKYLNAAATPLAFLNATNILGNVSQGFKAKVRGGVFQVKDLFLAKLPHLWPELAVTSHQLPESTFNRLQQIACDAIHQEIQTLLGRPSTGGPAEREEKGGDAEGAPRLRRRPAPGGGQERANREKMCQTRDLKRVVFYYTGGKFVCFREDEVLHDIAQNDTQKYSPAFLAKIKKRGAASLPSPVIGAAGRVEISHQEGQDNRDKYKEVDFGARQDTFNELEKRFGGS